MQSIGIAIKYLPIRIFIPCFSCFSFLIAYPFAGLNCFVIFAALEKPLPASTQGWREKEIDLYVIQD
jgi:hypothetical protein